MCSCTSASPSLGTTWAASVPHDLTDTIAAAVGVQPVRAQAPLKLSAQQMQQQSCKTVQQTFTVISNSSSNSGPEICGSLGCSAGRSLADNRSDAIASTHHVTNLHHSSRRSCQQPVPIRRPTVAEIRAASPADCSGFEQLSDASCSSVTGSLKAVHIPQQQQWGAAAAGRHGSSSSWTAVFDDMDDLQTPKHELTPHSRSSSLSEPESEGMDEKEQYFEVPSSSHVWEALSNPHSQDEQQQLLCQIWSQLHLPVQPEEEQCEPVSAGYLGSHSNSCCSDDEAHCSRWPPLRSSFDSSCYSSSDASPTMASSSQASSICSSGSRRSSEKRVSWGTVTEYKLPPEPQYSWVWGVVPGWLQMSSSRNSKVSAAGCSRSDMVVAGAAAAGLVVAVAGAAVMAYARRPAS